MPNSPASRSGSSGRAASPARRRAEPPRSFPLRASRGVLVAVFGWLAVASAGLLAARAWPLALRAVLVLGLWAVALPAIRRDLALAAPGSLRRVELRDGLAWRIACKPGEPAVPAAPSPYCAILGALLWLKFDTAAGPRRACVVDRALAARLRLGGYRAGRRGKGGEPSC